MVILPFGFGETWRSVRNVDRGTAGEGPQHCSVLSTLLADPLGHAAQTCVGAVAPQEASLPTCDLGGSRACH